MMMTDNKCPKCGNEAIGESGTSVICQSCGIVPNPNHCPKCGNEMANWDLIVGGKAYRECVECGHEEEG